MVKSPIEGEFVFVSLFDWILANAHAPKRDRTKMGEGISYLIQIGIIHMYRSVASRESIGF